MDLLHPDYLTFIKQLNFNEVEYMVVGGLAVNLYGYHRMTGDIDVLYKSEPSNAKRLIKALDVLGYKTSSISEQDLIKPSHMRLGVEPNTIDIFNTTKGVNYELAFRRAKKFKVEGIEFKVIHINDLISNKTSLNTFKDLADADALKKILLEKKK